MIEQFRIDLKSSYPKAIVDALLDSFIKMRENYYLEKHEPAELNGGKFVEACVRLIQYHLTGNYVPIGKKIPNMVVELRNFENSPTNSNDSYRIHIPRVLLSIYNLRNRRGVGHLGGDINPNLADSTFIASAANWVLAELYRIHYTISLAEAQKIVDDLVVRKIALIHDLGKIKRVLDPTLSARNKILLLLYSAYPKGLSDDELRKSVEYSNYSYFKKQILGKLHRERFIEYSSEGICLILPPGIKFVEENQIKWLSDLNRRK